MRRPNIITHTQLRHQILAPHRLFYRITLPKRKAWSGGFGVGEKIYNKEIKPMHLPWSDYNYIILFKARYI
jgi:hypothetical protein